MLLTISIIIASALFAGLFVCAKAVAETSHDIGKRGNPFKPLKIPLGKLTHLLK